MEDRLRSIIDRALDARPTSVSFEFQEDSKSFWSESYRASLTWPNSVDTKVTDNAGKQLYPSKLFIKLPAVSENAVRMSTDDEAEEVAEGERIEDTLKILTQNEVDFYHYCSNTDLGMFRIPKYYLAEGITGEKTGCLVVEDMGDSLGSVYSEEYVPGYSVEQTFILMKSLAHFHYYFITIKDQSWMKKFSCVDSEEFQKMKFESAKMFEELDPQNFSGKVDQIKQFFSTEHTTYARTGFIEDGLPPVLVHQDLNPTNVLWTKKMDNIKLGAIIDFQMVVSGSICEDMVRILSLGVDVETRRKNTESALSAYFDELTRLFNGTPPFSYRQLINEYRRVFAFSNTFTLFGLSAYYGQYKEKEMPEDAREVFLSEFVHRAQGIIDDILTYNNDNKENSSSL